MADDTQSPDNVDEEFEAFTVEDMLQEFVEGLQDAFARLDQGIVALEQDPRNEQLLNEICRAAHSVKGTAAFMDLTDMSELAHKMEDLLDGFRQGGIEVQPEFIDLLLDCLDAFREVTENAIQRTGQQVDLSPYFERLDAVAREVLQQEGESGEAEPSEDTPIQEVPVEVEPAVQTPDRPKTEPPEPDQPTIQYVRAEDMADEFYEALTEALSELEHAIVALEENPDDRDIVNRVGRAAHSIKGIAGFLSLEPMVDLSHAMESAFKGFSLGADLDPHAFTDVLLACLDSFRVVAEKRACEDTDAQVMVALRERLQSALKVAVAPEPRSEPEQTSSAPPAEPAPPPTPKPTPKAKVPSSKPTGPKGQRAAASTTLRVSNERIDDLMNLVGELVIARNRLAQLGAQSLSGELRETVNLISTVSTELHRKITAVRMVPVEELFQTFPRLVRDVARDTGKKVRLELTGQHTELDKTLIEAIRDPMIHLIRNCVDHGIEPPDVRQARGKPETGRLVIGARQAHNYVIIDIEDDGGGIDPQKVKAKAIEQGVISDDEGERMADDQAIRLIFSPGFSTAEVVSEVSGRGIGMDVVRQNVESLGGSIEIQTKIGQGTRFSLKLPLTLAIISALLVRTDERVYALPLSSVDRTVAVPVTDIEYMKGQAMIFLQGQLLSLMPLRELLGAERSPESLAPDDHGNINVVVVGLTEKSVGLVVDQTVGIEEIVIKPLGAYLGDVDGIGGATILGDGSVIMVLDPVRLIRSMEG